jgi:hypothetical protein
MDTEFTWDVAVHALIVVLYPTTGKHIEIA